jgi:hypothetical protein
VSRWSRDPPHGELSDAPSQGTSGSAGAGRWRAPTAGWTSCCRRCRRTRARSPPARGAPPRRSGSSSPGFCSCSSPCFLPAGRRADLALPLLPWPTLPRVNLTGLSRAVPVIAMRMAAGGMNAVAAQIPHRAGLLSSSALANGGRVDLSPRTLVAGIWQLRAHRRCSPPATIRCASLAECFRSAVADVARRSTANHCHRHPPDAQRRSSLSGRRQS